MNNNNNSSSEEKKVQREINRRTITSFILFFVLMGGGYMGWLWLKHQPQSAGNTQPLLRRSFQANEKLFSGLYSAHRQAKHFEKKDAAVKVRVNGDVGMGDDFDPKTWQLKVARRPGDTLVLTMDDIKALPKTEVVFDFKCIEGWDQVSYWGGVRFSDFAKKYNLAPQCAMKYVGLITPDSTYYVGIDMPSMEQPQTILCYEMNGKPLPYDQGFPLRLIIPVKYGIKHLKRVSVMYFSNEKPKDYWAEQGYDYYSGL